MSFDSNSILIADSFRIYYYAIIIVVGALMAGYLSSLQAQKRNINPELAWDALIWILGIGLIGARLYHVLTPMPSLSSTVNYWANPLTIITGIRNGGLGMLGGIMGGLLGLGLFTLGWNIATEKERRQGKPFIFLQKDPQLYFPTWLDIVSPGILLAQSIGRWGNYVNQELYGAPTNLPWKLYIDPAHRIPSVAQSEYFHPTFLYESILTLAGCFLLLYLEKRLKHWLRPGDLFLIYIIYYAIVRFGMEFLRLDSHLLGSLNTNQLVVGVGAAIATIILLVRHQGRRKPIATA